MDKCQCVNALVRKPERALRRKLCGFWHKKELRNVRLIRTFRLFHPEIWSMDLEEEFSFVVLADAIGDHPCAPFDRYAPKGDERFCAHEMRSHVHECREVKRIRERHSMRIKFGEDFLRWNASKERGDRNRHGAPGNRFFGELARHAAHSCRKAYFDAKPSKDVSHGHAFGARDHEMAARRIDGARRNLLSQGGDDGAEALKLSEFHVFDGVKKGVDDLDLHCRSRGRCCFEVFRSRVHAYSSGLGCRSIPLSLR